MLKTGARTIFIAVNTGSNVRDILRCNVLKTLKTSGHRIVILSPTGNDPAFRAEFESDNVIVEQLHEHHPGRLEFKVNSLRFTLFPDLSDTIKILTSPLVKRGPLKRALARNAVAAVRLIGRANMRKALMWVNTYAFPDKHHAELFRKYQPSLVCLTEFFHMAPDMWVLKRAVREGVPTIGLVHSWDNLTTKGAFPARVDRLVVWSETMRREAVQLHGYRAGDVFVGGVPQFDAYTDVDNLPSREEFFRRIGADPSKKLISYALVPTGRFPGEMGIVENLSKLIQANQMAFPSQLLVRLYPHRTSEIPAHLKNQPGLLFDLPGSLSAYPDRDISLADLRHLAATMRYSDVVVNVASTISVDAAVFGTPVIGIAFDGPTPMPYLESVRRFYDMTHFKRLLATGGIRVANTFEELVDHLNAYLRNPALDSEGRQRIIQTECYTMDGRAGERIANFILERLDEVSAGPPRPTRAPDSKLARSGA